MTLIIHCQNKHELEAEETWIGRRVKCPACQSIMRLSGKGLAEYDLQDEDAGDEPIFDDEDALRRRKSKDAKLSAAELFSSTGERENLSLKTREGLRRVSVGLALYYARIVGMLVATLISFLVIILVAGSRAGSGGRAESPGGWVDFLTSLQNLAATVTGGLGLLGSICCLYVPLKSNARTFMTLSLACDVGSVAVILLAGFLGIGVALASPIAGALVVVVLLLSWPVLVFLGWLFFVLFLRDLGVYLKESGWGEEAVKSMLRIVFYTVATVVVTAFLLFLACLGIHPYALLILYMLWGLVWFYNLIKAQLELLQAISHLRHKAILKYQLRLRVPKAAF